MPEVNTESSLQWRKIIADKSSKGMPWRSPASQERASHPSEKAIKFLTPCGKNEVHQFIHGTKKEEVVLKHRMYVAPTKQEIASSKLDQKRCNIVPTRKMQYSHLLSSQKVVPNDVDSCPVVYKSEKQGRKEVAAIWFQQLTGVDEY